MRFWALTRTLTAVPVLISETNSPPCILWLEKSVEEGFILVSDVEIFQHGGLSKTENSPEK